MVGSTDDTRIVRDDRYVQPIVTGTPHDAAGLSPNVMGYIRTSIVENLTDLSFLDEMAMGVPLSPRPFRRIGLVERDDDDDEEEEEELLLQLVLTTAPALEGDKDEKRCMGEGRVDSGFRFDGSNGQMSNDVSKENFFFGCLVCVCM
jgi:hypothetical protein